MNFTIDQIVTCAKAMPKSIVASVWVDHMDTLKPLFDFGQYREPQHQRFEQTFNLRGIEVFVDAELAPRTVEFRDTGGRVLKSVTRA